MNALAISEGAQAPLFDYDSLNYEKRLVVQEAAERIKANMRVAARTVIEMGGQLARVKDVLTPKQFDQWLATEFQWKERSAQVFMAVWQHYGTADYDVAKIAPSALYQLSAPSTPPAARKVAQRLVESGERVGVNKAKEIIAEAKKVEAPTLLPESEPVKAIDVEVVETPMPAMAGARELIPQPVALDADWTRFNESYVTLEVTLDKCNGSTEREAGVILYLQGVGDDCTHKAKVKVPASVRPFEFVMPTVTRLLDELQAALRTRQCDAGNVCTERTQAEISEWAKRSNALKIAEQSHGVTRVSIDGKPFIVTGYASKSGRVEAVWAAPCLPIAEYGEQDAKTYAQAQNVRDKMTALSYAGIKVNCGTAKKPDYWVMLSDDMKFTVASGQPKEGYSKSEIGGTPPRTERTLAEIEEWSKTNNCARIPTNAPDVQRIYVDGNPYVVVSSGHSSNGDCFVNAYSVLPAVIYGEKKGHSYKEKPGYSEGLRLNCGTEKKPDVWMIAWGEPVKFAYTKPVSGDDCICEHPESEHGNGDAQGWTGCGVHQCECSEYCAKPTVNFAAAASRVMKNAKQPKSKGAK